MNECVEVIEVSNKTNLIEFMKESKMLNKSVSIFVSSPDLEDYECISNTPRNIDAKIAYYDKAYNDDLTLKSNNSIKIVAMYNIDFEYVGGE